MVDMFLQACSKGIVDVSSVIMKNSTVHLLRYVLERNLILLDK